MTMLAAVLRQFFLWRAERRLAKERYKLDRRRYPGRLKAGFFADLRQERFFESRQARHLRARRWRHLLFALLGLIALGLLGWLIYESIGALNVF